MYCMRIFRILSDKLCILYNTCIRWVGEEVWAVEPGAFLSKKNEDKRFVLTSFGLNFQPLKSSYVARFVLIFPLLLSDA